ncbi:ThuA domain-containing protein [Saccharopolyspora sp. CA-218241]|uniref:ThuA domain-containing protein n=1 Tax=Saccharopolyspora sp. CA-218241 TaxID=3240027 RepID=UPI003D957FFC
MRTAILTAVLLAAAALAVPAAAAPEHGRQHVLVFSKTAGFRHDSIEDGIAAIEKLGHRHGFTVESTEDSKVFTDARLRRYDAVVWLSTTGDVLDPAQQGAFERYVRGGGGFMGVHAAADTEYDWPFYGELVGAYFTSHPEIQPATVLVEDRHHDSTAHLPERWDRTDEWYNYATNPRGAVHVLASLDEASYDPGDGAMGDHPIAWCHTIDDGRAFYTGGGHTRESFDDPAFLRHLLGGIRTATGLRPC